MLQQTSNAAKAETFHSCPEILTLPSECCRSDGAEDLAPGQMSSKFSHSFRRCRVSLSGSVAPQGWLTCLSPLHPHVQLSEQTPDRKASAQVTLLCTDMGSVSQMSGTAGAITPHIQRDWPQIRWKQHWGVQRLKKAAVWAKHCLSALEKVSALFGFARGFQVRVNYSLTLSTFYVKYIVGSKRSRALVKVLLTCMFKLNPTFSF